MDDMHDFLKEFVLSLFPFDKSKVKDKKNMETDHTKTFKGPSILYGVSPIMCVPKTKPLKDNLRDISKNDSTSKHNSVSELASKTKTSESNVLKLFSLSALSKTNIEESTKTVKTDRKEEKIQQTFKGLGHHQSKTIQESFSKVPIKTKRSDRSTAALEKSSTQKHHIYDTPLGNSSEYKSCNNEKKIKLNVSTSVTSFTTQSNPNKIRTNVTAMKQEIKTLRTSTPIGVSAYLSPGNKRHGIQGHNFSRSISSIYGSSSSNNPVSPGRHELVKVPESPVIEFCVPHTLQTKSSIFSVPTTLSSGPSTGTSSSRDNIEAVTSLHASNSSGKHPSNSKVKINTAFIEATCPISNDGDNVVSGKSKTNNDNNIAQKQLSMTPPNVQSCHTEQQDQNRSEKNYIFSPVATSTDSNTPKYQNKYASMRFLDCKTFSNSTNSNTPKHQSEFGIGLFKRGAYSSESSSPKYLDPTLFKNSQQVSLHYNTPTFDKLISKNIPVPFSSDLQSSESNSIKNWSHAQMEDPLYLEKDIFTNTNQEMNSDQSVTNAAIDCTNSFKHVRPPENNVKANLDMVEKSSENVTSFETVLTSMNIPKKASKDPIMNSGTNMTEKEYSEKKVALNYPTSSESEIKSVSVNRLSTGVLDAALEETNVCSNNISIQDQHFRSELSGVKSPFTPKQKPVSKKEFIFSSCSNSPKQHFKSSKTEPLVKSSERETPIFQTPSQTTPINKGSFKRKWQPPPCTDEESKSSTSHSGTTPYPNSSS